ncbi:MAG: hypothetical protein JW795_08580, partial [Chitinivibrionales bacterium]|nr:hypothetical protein [Chitinivibrionales bacterium]
QLLQELMMQCCAVIRSGQGLSSCAVQLATLQQQCQTLSTRDTSLVFNTELMEILEFFNMLSVSQALVASALARQESRGGHFRSDFPRRNDDTWAAHSLCHQENGVIRLAYKPVRTGEYGPARHQSSTDSV